MRKIKFRAWLKKFNEMQFVDNIDFIDDMRIELDDEISPYEKYAYVEDYVLMQYTGLKDKNGKEIYEGDIFKTSLDVVAVVEWEKEGRFLGYTNNRRIIYVNREPQVEVIGNMYDNPELMKECHE